MTNGSRQRLVAALLTVFGFGSSGLVQAGEIVWHRRPQAAQREARQLARPILLYVGASFCGYCRRMDQTTWIDDFVARTIANDFVPLHVDGSQEIELSGRLAVRGFPTIVVLSPAGRLLARADGYLGPAEMRAFLEPFGQHDPLDAYAGQ